MKVSAAIICRDEQRDLPACLESLGWCSEVVVTIDTRTTDRTAEIARAAGAKVFIRDFDGWSGQKNFTFAKCKGTWILSIDADERVSPELRDEILDAIDSAECVNGYYLPRTNLWLGRWIRHGGWFPDYTLRLFRRGHGECRYAVHERIEIDGESHVLQQPLTHDNIQHLNEHLVTALRATDAEAREMVANGARFYWLPPLAALSAYFGDVRRARFNRLEAYLLAKKHFKNKVEVAWLVPFLPFAKFLHMYVLKQGFRDGAHGFWLATLSALYVIIKYAKYWELSRHRADGAVSRRGSSPRD